MIAGAVLNIEKAFICVHHCLGYNKFVWKSFHTIKAFENAKLVPVLRNSLFNNAKTQTSFGKTIEPYLILCLVLVKSSFS